MTTENLTEKADQLYNYVQERCLWQFFSRTWDRQENIEGILHAASELLCGRQPPRHSPQEKLFYSDAVTMVADFKQRFPWIEAEQPSHIHELMQAVKEKVTDIAITKSQNHELNHSLY